MLGYAVEQSRRKCLDEENSSLMNVGTHVTNLVQRRRQLGVNNIAERCCIGSECLLKTLDVSGARGLWGLPDASFGSVAFPQLEETQQDCGLPS
ncbi:hypothetical protein JCM33374_g5317 [Metschnikowia sp. JCM 33374]|nr:hypothetical protein JCM33374_g5317 [Metschnikowia sp. JCM 33374]